MKKADTLDLSVMNDPVYVTKVIASLKIQSLYITFERMVRFKQLFHHLRLKHAVYEFVTKLGPLTWALQIMPFLLSSHQLEP